MQQVHAATPWMETFTGDMNGWSTSGSPAWSSAVNRAQVTFAASPTPQASTLLATGTLFSAAFTGDYTSAGIALMGFRFRAEQVLPSVLTVRWTSKSTGYFRNVQSDVLATGQWYQFRFLMTSKEAGGWDGDPAGLFTNVLADVDTVAIAVTKPATVSPSTFMVDDVFIERLPAAISVNSGTGSTRRILWTHLLTNMVYGLESSTNLAGPWASEQSFTATNRQQETESSVGGYWYYWRLLML